MEVEGKSPESCGKAIAKGLSEAPMRASNGRCTLDLVSVARPRSRGRTSTTSKLTSSRLLGAEHALDPGAGRGLHLGTTISHGRSLRLLARDKVRPAQPFHRHFREKVRPARHKPPIVGHFSCAGRTSSRSHPPSDPTGRKMSHTGHRNTSVLKEKSPLREVLRAVVKYFSPTRVH